METINFTPEALADLEYWKKSGNQIVLKRIRQFLQAIQNTRSGDWETQSPKI